MLSPFTQKFILFLTVPLLIIAFISLSNIKKMLHQSALEQLKGHMLELVEHQAAEITGKLDKATAIAQTTANLAGILHPIKEKDLFLMLESNLEQLPIIYGAALAYESNSYFDKKLFAPYVYHENDQLKHIELSTDAYDYTDKQWQWWHGPRNLGKGIWTAPYFDEGAGNTLMVTYSTPFFSDKQFKGVSTVDIDLTKLQQTLKLESLKDIKYIILTNTGHFAYHYKTELIGQSYIELANKLNMKKALVLGKKMIAGESGFYALPHKGHEEWIFYAPVGNYGWSFAIRTSESLAGQLVDTNTNYASLWLLVLVLLGLGLTHFVSKSTIVNPILRLKNALQELQNNNSNTLEKSHFPSPIQEIANLILRQYKDKESILNSQLQTQEQLQIQLKEKNTDLRKNKRQLMGFINAAQNPTIDLNAAGEILLANDKFKTFINKADIHGLTLPSLVHASQKSKMTQTLNLMFKELKPQTIQGIHLNVIDADPLICTVIFTPIILSEDEIEASVIFLVKETL